MTRKVNYAFRVTDQGFRITAFGMDGHLVLDTQKEAVALIKLLNDPKSNDFGWGFDHFPEEVADLTAETRSN